MRYSIIAGLISTIISTSSTAQTPVLTVYTYDSFVSDWGPGPQIEAAFEAQCACDLQFVAAGDGAALLSRLRLEGQRTKADVVLGLDTNLTFDAAKTGLFANHGIHGDFDIPAFVDDPLFIPYDWGYFAFVGDKGKTFPQNFKALAGSDVKIVIQDPRSSTPGLGLLLWVQAAYGDEAADIWKGLSDNIVTITKGWSEAYGLFLEAEADLVLSYTTSPAYHLIAEKDDSKVAVNFDEGHYMQVEVAGITAQTDHPKLAKEFLQFVMTDAFQSVIPTTNWMYPAIIPQHGLPEGFETLIKPNKALLFSPQKAAQIKSDALSQWLTVLSK